MLYKIGAAYVLIRTAGFIVAFQSLSRLYYGTSMDSLVLLVSLKHFKVDFDERLSTKKSKITKLFVIAAGLIGQKRSVALAVIIYLAHRQKRVLFAVSLVAVGAIMYLDFVDWRQVGFIGRYLSVTDLDFLKNNQSMRVAEVVTAYSAWTSGIGSFLFGHGFGAEILVTTGRGDYAELLHSLHNTPMALAYRSGLVGLVVFIYILKVGLTDLVLGSKSDGAIITALFVASFFFFSFIDEVFVGFYAAKILEASKMRRPVS